MLGIDAFVFGNDNLAILVGDIEAGNFTAEAGRHESHSKTIRAHRKFIEIIELSKDAFRSHSKSLEHDSARHLASAVYTEVSTEQFFTRTMCFTFIMLKEHTRRAVQLRNDDTFGTIDDE